MLRCIFRFRKSDALCTYGITVGRITLDFNQNTGSAYDDRDTDDDDRARVISELAMPVRYWAEFNCPENYTFVTLSCAFSRAQ